MRERGTSGPLLLSLCSDRVLQFVLSSVVVPATATIAVSLLESLSHTRRKSAAILFPTTFLSSTQTPLLLTPQTPLLLLHFSLSLSLSLSLH